MVRESSSSRRHSNTHGQEISSLTHPNDHDGSQREVVSGEIPELLLQFPTVNTDLNRHFLSSGKVSLRVWWMRSRPSLSRVLGDCEQPY